MSIVSDFTALLYYLESPAYRWNATEALGTPVIVTYSFLTGDDLPSVDDIAADGFNAAAVTALTEDQQSHFRQAADQFEAASGIKLVEVESGAGMVELFTPYDMEDFAGYAYIPFVLDGDTSRGFLAIEGNSDWAPGGFYHQIILHELGHAVGLSHSHEGPFVLAPDLDTTATTVMSYGVVQPYATDLRDMDKAALQAIYGPAVSADWRFEWSPETDRLMTWLSDGDDVVLTPDGATRTVAGQGDDTVIGREGDDVMLGCDGRDVLDGGHGDDRLMGGMGEDLLRGGDGDDRLFGNDGADVLVGGAGNDFLQGAGGIDRLSGGDGDDRLKGGGGADLLSGGDGDDILMGGAGQDEFEFDGGRDQIVDWSAEIIYLDSGLLIWPGSGDVQAVLNAADVKAAGVELQFGSDQLMIRGVDTVDELSPYLVLV